MELLFAKPDAVGPTGLKRSVYTPEDGADTYFMYVGNEHGVISFGIFVDSPPIGRGGHGSVLINGTWWHAQAIGIHGVKPLHEGQEATPSSCLFFDGVPCYFDVSFMHAHDLLAQIPEHDEEWLWTELEGWHTSRWPKS